MIYYNCHTHIFSGQYVPDNVVGIPLMNTLAVYPRSKWLVKIFGRLRHGAVNTQIERIARFAEIGLNTSQESIFNTLEDYYKGWGNMRFVVLMMDMEQMGAGLPLSNYATQLNEMIRLRAKGNYANTLLPFIFVDPRRPEFTNGIVLRDWVKKYFDDYGFVGIKMYPALGYYPFDEKLDELYEWAEKMQVPVLYHCIQGVIHYRGLLNGFPEPRFSSKYHKLDETDPQKYQRNFTDPDNYHHVLKMFPKLKINLAHYGGDEVMLARKEDGKRWYKTVRALAADPEKNVYTDVAFSLYNTGIFKLMHEDVQTPVLGDRILFGTDYFVVEKDKDEAMLRDEMRNSFAEFDRKAGIAISSFDRISMVNPTHFLASEYYQP